MTNEELKARINTSKGSLGSKPVNHAWNYEEPYQTILIESTEKEDSKVEITVAFKVGSKIVEKNFIFHTEGSASYYWENFLNSAFPDASELVWEQVLGRPFVAEIVKNGKYDNLKVLSGYKGNYPEEFEGLQ